jgi:predicted GIY-YIG superfamily endonuclease
MQKDFIVYILSDKRKNTITGIMESIPEFQSELRSKYKSLVYLGIFKDIRKAMKKKRSIMNLEHKERILFVKKKNPEWLNLIFTLSDYFKKI